MSKERKFEVKEYLGWFYPIELEREPVRARFNLRKFWFDIEYSVVEYFIKDDNGDNAVFENLRDAREFIDLYLKGSVYHPYKTKK